MYGELLKRFLDAPSWPLRVPVLWDVNVSSNWKGEPNGRLQGERVLDLLAAEMPEALSRAHARLRHRPEQAHQRQRGIPGHLQEVPPRAERQPGAAARHRSSGSRSLWEPLLMQRRHGSGAIPSRSSRRRRCPGRPRRSNAGHGAFGGVREQEIAEALFPAAIWSRSTARQSGINIPASIR